jgi:mRNA interferase MazF
MTCKRGDVVLVPFPDSNLKTVKRRPVLVVQADGLNTGLPQVILAMISSNPARKGHACRVEVSVATPEGQQTGLTQDSVIMTDNLATVLEKRIERILGCWTDMAAVDAALRHTLSL